MLSLGEYKMKLLLFIAVLNLFVACGIEKDVTKAQIPQKQEHQEERVKYEAKLSSLNNSVAGLVNGEVSVSIKKDVFKVSISLYDAPPGIIHQQYVYTSDVCPTLANDFNQDGFIDYIEALDAAKTILIPLDNELSSQIPEGHYPVTNSSGNYFYTQSTSMSRMIKDLRGSDPKSNDDISKLNSRDHFNLTGRIVIVHGVDHTNELPPSVATKGNIPSHRTLPIACGVLIKVTENKESEKPFPIPRPLPSPPNEPVETAFSS
jgi:hypothetical protein